MAARTRFVVPAHVIGLVRGLHPDIKSKVRAGLDAIRANPTIEGKALKRELEDLRSLRVGRFRIVYRITADELNDSPEAPPIDLGSTDED